MLQGHICNTELILSLKINDDNYLCPDIAFIMLIKCPQPGNVDLVGTFFGGNTLINHKG